MRIYLKDVELVLSINSEKLPLFDYDEDAKKILNPKSKISVIRTFIEIGKEEYLLTIEQVKVFYRHFIFVTNMLRDIGYSSFHQDENLKEVFYWMRMGMVVK